MSCGLGGIGRSNDPELAIALRRIHDELCSEPTLGQTLGVGVLHGLHRRFFNSRLYWTARAGYRVAGKVGLVQGSSSVSELLAPTMPRDYLRRFGKRRNAQLDRALAGACSTIVRRREIAAIYRQRLASWGNYLPAISDAQESVELRLPLRVDRRSGLLDDARRERVELGDWFNAPLHPAEAPGERFGYTLGSCPEAEAAAAELVNLPTHAGVGNDQARRILDFLESRRDQLIQLPLHAVHQSALPEHSRGKDRGATPRSAGAVAVS